MRWWIRACALEGSANERPTIDPATEFCRCHPAASAAAVPNMDRAGSDFFRPPRRAVRGTARPAVPQHAGPHLARETTERRASAWDGSTRSGYSLAAYLWGARGSHRPVARRGRGLYDWNYFGIIRWILGWEYR